MIWDIQSKLFLEVFNSTQIQSSKYLNSFVQVAEWEFSQFAVNLAIKQNIIFKIRMNNLIGINMNWFSKTDILNKDPGLS